MYQYVQAVQKAACRKSKWKEIESPTYLKAHLQDKRALKPTNNKLLQIHLHLLYSYLRSESLSDFKDNKCKTSV